jgi:hypothetical protein
MEVKETMLTTSVLLDRQIVGIMAACERFLTDAEERNIEFIIRLFQKQLQRLTVTLDRFIVRVHLAKVNDVQFS